MIGGLKDVGDIANALKKAKEAKARIEEARKEIGNAVVQASSPCGEATATVNGDGTVIDLEITSSLAESGDAQNIGPVALSAIAAAQTQARGVASDRIARVYRDLGLPENLELPI